MAEIKAVGIDLDGVLVKSFTSDPIPGVSEELAFLRERGLPLCVITNQAGPLWHEITGERKYPTVGRLVRQLDTAATNLGLRDIPWFIAVHDARLNTAMLNRFLLASTMSDQHPELAIDMEHMEEEAEEAEKQVYLYAVTIAGKVHEWLTDVFEVGHWQVSADPAWRKPGIGMLEAAAAQFGITLSDMAFVDDMKSGEEAARSAGCLYAASLDELCQMLKEG